MYFCLNGFLSGMQDSCEEATPPVLRMVRIYAKVSEQQLLSTGVLASPVWFNRDKYRVDIF